MANKDSLKVKYVFCGGRCMAQRRLCGTAVAVMPYKSVDVLYHSAD